MLNGGFLSGPHESIMGGGTPLCPYDSNGVCYSDGTVRCMQQFRRLVSFHHGKGRDESCSGAGRDASCSGAGVVSITCMPVSLLLSALSMKGYNVISRVL